MKKYFFIFLLILLLPDFVEAQDQADLGGKTITLVADEWCPYNCVSGSDKLGYMIEIAKAIFEPKGIKVEYEVMPWERAIEEARRGTYTGIIGSRVDEAPDFIIPEEPLGYTTDVFYVKADSNWKYEGIKSLENTSLGVISGYSYKKNLDKYINDNYRNIARIQSISGDMAMAQNFKKLEKGRIDAYVEDLNVAQKYIADNSLWGKFKVAGEEKAEAKENYVYISFSPHVRESGDYAKILSQGIKDLRKSGKMDEILSKYNVEDWINKK